MTCLRVYMRSYCHLCEDMLQALAPFQARYGFALQVIDIEDQPELEARYGEKVPVLAADDKELCHYFLDVRALDAYFASTRGAPPL